MQPSEQPDRRDGESRIAYARRLVESGHADGSISFQMTLPAGMVVEMVERAPQGMRLQRITQVLVADALMAGRWDVLETVQQDLGRVADDLGAIRQAVSRLHDD